MGRHAAQRALARLEPRQVATGEYPVLFSNEMARSLIGHLLGPVSGGALYRRASFLVDSAGMPLFPDWFSIHERPSLPRGLRSAAFDSDIVAARHSAFVATVLLQRNARGPYSPHRPLPPPPSSPAPRPH